MTQKYYRPCFPNNMTDKERELIDMIARYYRKLVKARKEKNEPDDNL